MFVLSLHLLGVWWLCQRLSLEGLWNHKLKGRDAKRRAKVWDSKWFERSTRYDKRAAPLGSFLFCKACFPSSPLGHLIFPSPLKPHTNCHEQKYKRERKGKLKRPKRREKWYVYFLQTKTPLVYAMPCQLMPTTEPNPAPASQCNAKQCNPSTR